MDYGKSGNAKKGANAPRFQPSKKGEAPYMQKSPKEELVAKLKAAAAKGKSKD